LESTTVFIGCTQMLDTFALMHTLEQPHVERAVIIGAG
jgi:hypothetical protein